jgi:hypothetical protein
MATKKPGNIKAAKSKKDGDEKPQLEDNATPISQAAYAKRRGVTRQFIGKLVKDQIITLHDGMVIPALADKERAAWADPAREHRQKKNTPDNGKAGSVTEGDPEEFSDAKVLEALKDQLSNEELKVLELLLKKMPNWHGARRIGEAVKAQNELLEYQQARGLLVEAAGVEQAWADKLALVKTKMLAIPRKMAQEVAALVLRYAAQLGRELAKTVKSIKKKKSGRWAYNKKTGALEFYSGKVKKPFATIGISLEAPDHAESMVINETETALASEVHGVLNELAGEKESDGQ